MSKYLLIVTGLTLGLMGCAQVPENDSTQPTSTNIADYMDTDSSVDTSEVDDPFEGFNRAMWDFNYDYLDPYVVRPVSLTYVNYTPSPIRTGINNFLSNLDEPAAMVNSLLILDGKDALTHFNRFWINSTFGLAGLIDIASAANITKPVDREFGDTLGYYGVGNGPYLMLPFYGPITIRGFADNVDDLYFPLSLLNFWEGLGKWVFEGMESRAQLAKQEALLKNSPDPYVFTRDAFLQYQNFKAADGKQAEPTQEEDFDESFLDEIDNG